MVYCSKCGKINNDNDFSCSNCGATLMKREYNHIGGFNSFEMLFTKENINTLENTRLSEDEYNMILKNICDLGKYNYEKIINNPSKSKLNNSNVFNNIFNITSAYTDINYKSKGAELGSYAFNNINVDDRLDKSQQIATLIHELAHHLLAEIFEQILMYIFEVKKTKELESIAHFALVVNTNAKLMNEYCAHTVEGRFIPHGYQNYGSFNSLLVSNFDLKKEAEMVKFNMILGNTFADDIISIIENFVPADLRDKIKTQFKSDYSTPPNYSEILLEHKEVIDFKSKSEFISVLLLSSFNAAKNKNFRDLLDYLNSNYADSY